LEVTNDHSSSLGVIHSGPADEEDDDEELILDDDDQLMEDDSGRLRIRWREKRNVVGGAVGGINQQDNPILKMDLKGEQGQGGHQTKKRKRRILFTKTQTYQLESRFLVSEVFVCT